MSFKVVIPARYDSTRFPGKPLADINGKSMIHWVYDKSTHSDAEEVIVATDDDRIAEEVIMFGGDVEFTERTHKSGTDRIAEVANNRNWNDDVVVVNVQGDSPLISPTSINQVVEIHSSIQCNDIATLVTPIFTKEELENPNIVKCVMTSSPMNLFHALYFSRSPIPYNATFGYRHLGIYCYDVNTLLSFVSHPRSNIEICEQLEQLRALSYGFQVNVAVATDPHRCDVDTPEDLETVRSILQ